MSCLPLFSFNPSLSSALKPQDASSGPRPYEQQQPAPMVTPSLTNEVDDLYDKISRVSVSHRRVDSFEWVMAQSAPNTPPTSLDSKYEPYSPPAARVVGSAPLPVPNEMWSSNSQACDGRQKRGYFDWWPSPILGSNKGYTKLSTSDDGGKSGLGSPSANRPSMTGSSQPFKPQTGPQTPTSPYLEDHEVRPSQELNALGIVFPCTPPPSPPASHMAYEPKCAPQASASQSSKRVSFSPIVDEAAPETFPGFGIEIQPSLSWGSYLPSSFLVARPPLTRTASSPAARRTRATRPILKRSSSTYQHPVRRPMPSTEMIHLSRMSNGEDTLVVASPIPKQRLSLATLRANGSRQVGDNSVKTDSAFVEMLQPTKPTRRRCDSLLSNTSLSVVNECTSR